MSRQAANNSQKHTRFCWLHVLQARKWAESGVFRLVLSLLYHISLLKGRVFGYIAANSIGPAPVHASPHLSISRPGLHQTECIRAAQTFCGREGGGAKSHGRQPPHGPLASHLMNSGTNPCFRTTRRDYRKRDGQAFVAQVDQY